MPSTPSNAAQRMRLGALRARRFRGKDDPAWVEFMAAFGCTSIADLTWGQAKEAIDVLEGRMPKPSAHYRGDIGEEYCTQKQANEIARLEAALGWFGEDKRLAGLIRRITKDKYRGSGAWVTIGEMVSRLYRLEARNVIQALRSIQAREGSL